MASDPPARLFDADPADHLAVVGVVGRAALIADEGDLEDYASAYTDDAVWDLAGSVRHGLGEIIAGARSRRLSGEAGPGTGTRHVPVVQDVRFSGPDTATVDSYWMFYRSTGRHPQLASMGRYRDTLRRTSEGWRIAERAITVG